MRQMLVSDTDSGQITEFNEDKTKRIEQLKSKHFYVGASRAWDVVHNYGYAGHIFYCIGKTDGNDYVLLVNLTDGNKFFLRPSYGVAMNELPTGTGLTIKEGA